MFPDIVIYFSALASGLYYAFWRDPIALAVFLAAEFYLFFGFPS